MYAVQNDKGEWLGCEIYSEEPDWFEQGGFIWKLRSVAEDNANKYGGQVIELYVIGGVVEKPKQYLVKVKGHFERPTYYALRFNEYLAFGYREQDQQKLSDYPAHPFTEEEIIKYGLENCEKVEVSNKGEKDE